MSILATSAFLNGPLGLGAASASAAETLHVSSSNGDDIVPFGDVPEWADTYLPSDARSKVDISSGSGGKSPFNGFPEDGRAVREEIEYIRGLPEKGKVRAYLRGVGDEIISGIKLLHGSHELGFHYNLHGGTRDDYMNAGGILATMGDIEIRYSRLAKKQCQVYFFRSSKTNLYDIVDERHPEWLFLPSRMGSLVTIFRLDSDYLIRAFMEGGAFNQHDIAISFDEGWMAKHNNGKHIGIPSSTFIAPPIDPFSSVKRRIGLTGFEAIKTWLTRDEKTLVAMRVIEQVAG